MLDLMIVALRELASQAGLTFEHLDLDPWSILWREELWISVVDIVQVDSCTALAPFRVRRRKVGRSCEVLRLVLVSVSAANIEVDDDMVDRNSDVVQTTRVQLRQSCLHVVPRALGSTLLVGVLR